MQHASDRWMYAQFMPLAHPAGLFACPCCGHWADDGFAILKETRPGGDEASYAVLCLSCEQFGPKEKRLDAAIEAWNWSSLTKTGLRGRRALAFKLAL